MRDTAQTAAPVGQGASQRASQGAMPPVQRDLMRRLRVADFAIKVTVALGLPWVIFLALQNAVANALSTLIFVVAVAGLMLPFRRGRHYLVRVLWICFGAIFCMAQTLMFGGSVTPGQPEIMFFALLAFPFLLFSWELERKTMLAMVALVAGTSVLALALVSLPTSRALLHTIVPQMDPDIIPMSDFFLRVTISSILLAELCCFAYLSRLSAQDAAAALAESRAAARVKGDFLTNMSHEIRTPMNGLIGMLEVLEAMGVSERQAPTIGTIRNSAFSLLRIIDDILDTSKIEAGKLSIEPARFDLIPLIEGVTQSLRPLADSTGVRLRLFIDPQIPEWVHSDAGRLRQILMNLISNGVKFSGRGLTGRDGEVIIQALRLQDDAVRFIIHDNGIGMDEGLSQRLFEPFSHGKDTPRGRITGTGLGLVITKNLITLLGGSIAVDSTVNAGTRIEVDLPMNPAKGPRQLPDVDGVSVICFELPDIDIRAGLQMMLERTRANVHFITSVEALVPLKRDLPDAPIILLPTNVAVLADELQRTLLRLLPNARFIRFSAERSAQYGMINARTYLLQIYPLMVTDFVRAIAVLGGRADPDPAEVVTPASAPTPEPKAPQGQKARLLVVEDNEINRMVLSKQLELLGYDFALANDGAEGFAEWQKGGFDLVLSDCHMPQVDGFEMTAMIRAAEAQEKRPATPIIAVTANALDGVAERCYAAGMDGYLAKPVELGALRDKLNTFLIPAGPAD